MTAISVVKKFIHSDLKINAIFLASCLALFFGCGVYLGLMRLELWSQVVDIWEARTGLPTTQSVPATPDPDSETFLSGHYLRYSLVRPIFIWATEIGVDYNTIYSYTLPLIVFICTVSLTLSSNHGRIRISPSSALALILFSCVFLLMDGRLTLAYTGVCLVLIGFSLKLSWASVLVKSACIMLGVYLCSVTSGALIAITIFSCIAIILEILRHKRNIILIFYVVLNIYCLYFFFGFYLMDGLVRSLGFYGSGLSSIINAAAHGYGIIIGRFMPLWIAVPFIIGVALLGIFVLVKTAKLMQFDELIGLLLLGTTVILGVWGLSIFALSLVPIAHLLLTMIRRFKL